MNPTDRYNAVFIILLIHGIGTLLPWNMFITANDYFVDYKLNVTNADGTEPGYRANFLPYLGLASKIPNVLVQAFNFLYQSGSVSLAYRIQVSLLLQMAVFAVTTALAIVNSSAWPRLFFGLTMLSAIIINMANGIYQNCICGVAATGLPPKYINAVVTGMNISGTFSALIMILAIAVSPDPRSAAIFYFTCAVVFLILCFVTYIYLTRNEFFHYHQQAISRAHSESGKPIIPTDKALGKWGQYLYIGKKTWAQCLNVFLVYFVSLSIFPAIQAEIKPVDDILPPVYFSPITCFLSFNFFAMVGNLLVSRVPKVAPKRLWIPIVARFAFIPLFLLCNYTTDNRVWEVLIYSDYVYIALGIGLALSSGYLSSLGMMYAPQSVDPEHGTTAGMMASFSIMLGILGGVTFSLFLSWIVTQ